MRVATDLLARHRASRSLRGLLARLMGRALDRIVGAPGEIREPPTDPARARRTADAFRAHTAARRAAALLPASTPDVDAPMTAPDHEARQSRA